MGNGNYMIEGHQRLASVKIPLQATATLACAHNDMYGGQPTWCGCLTEAWWEIKQSQLGTGQSINGSCVGGHQ